MRKLIVLVFVFALALGSCTSEPGKETTGGKSTKEVVDQYVDTLVTAPDRARAAEEAVNQRTKATHDAIEGQ